MSGSSAKRAAQKQRATARKKRQNAPIVVDSDSEMSSHIELSDSGSEAPPPKKKARRAAVQDADEEDAEHAKAGIVVQEPEDPEAELARLQETWVAPTYAFFSPDVAFGHDDDGRRYHDFRCAAKSCKSVKGRIVRRYLDTKCRGD
ncbi:hypothetical protein L226DRAFT_573046 [Lentinus tigrinus ALCF2SS1-7]|uniref:Uncharacterized protein n=1 Tax=Lentinus tigrinus ALCF2SS1-6 TaxID=1328759 RepID=A0A5C2RP85_9APHY|nr:hypothetical protein L227DRAFT_617950 [Lentinus tigrinus ALCF2SS1-6]RPD72627.1 hypothetical protein L226DRAFT_573046 [Lentinus tigrinus ALCF2SS1-7]